MCDFCEKYANVSGKHGTIRLGAENYMLFANSEKRADGSNKNKNLPAVRQRIDGRWDKWDS